jgi:hypothetical protein
MIRHSLSCERLKQPISKPHKTVLMVEVVVAAAAVVVVVVEVVVTHVRSFLHIAFCHNTQDHNTIKKIWIP